MRLHTLSSTLVGLEKQAMSYRRDVMQKDYPSDFYESIMNPEEAWLAKNEPIMSQ